MTGGEDAPRAAASGPTAPDPAPPDPGPASTPAGVSLAAADPAARLVAMRPEGFDPQTPVRLRPRRAQALSAMLPILGTFLLAPPFILVFARPTEIAGVPLLLAYLALVWAGLILGAWRLSSRLRRRLALGAPAPRGELRGARRMTGAQ